MQNVVDVVKVEGLVTWNRFVSEAIMNQLFRDWTQILVDAMILRTNFYSLIR